MKNKKELHRLSPFERQIFMHEMFSYCKYIDYSVINQYFPFVDFKPQGLKLPSAAHRMIMRDFKDLKDAGVIAYNPPKNNDWYESKECDYELRIPSDTDEKKRKYLEHLNLICHFIHNIIGLEEDLFHKESIEETELDEDILNYKLELQFDNEIEESIPNDYDLYKHTDPYVIEYIEIKGMTTLKEIKEDFKLLERLGYLEYNFYKRRFCMPDDFDFMSLPRQEYGIVRGDDGKLYI